ncbi:MAG: PAS domain S-box protein, partial [Acidobacteriota bacterium]|nr:PAS domain S-box protein [Acidobacteriota bacterium]
MSDITRGNTHQNANSSYRQGDMIEVPLLSEDLPVLVAVIDTKQRYCHLNRAYETFFGRCREELLGKTLVEVTGFAHHSAAEPYVKRALEGEGTTFFSSIPDGDGLLREVATSYAPRRDHEQKIIGCISLMQILPERNLYMEARERLGAIVDSSDDAIVGKTLDGVITSWNAAAEKIFGYTPAEAIGEHIFLIIPPEKRGEEEYVLSQLRCGKKIDHFETERRAKDGRTVFISLSVSPIRNAEGQVIGASKVARDITERVRLAETLRRSEEYRKGVIECMPECVKVLDRHGTVLHMNPAGLQMVEADEPEQVIGACVYPLIKEEHLPAFRALNESVFNGGNGGRLEFGLQGLKGTERIFETSVVPLRSGALNEVIGALSVTRDITSRKLAEKRDAFLVRLDDETRA